MNDETPMPERERLVLVDGSSYLYRAFHALPSLSTSDGRPTGAIHGVVAMLRKLVRETRPQYLAVVFDAPGPTFREQRYADYKANRPPMPDPLSGQLEPLYAVIDALGLPRLSEPGVEADDVIATLVERARAEGLEVLVSTGDKDLAQLVDDGVTLVNTMTGQVLDRDGVLERFGVPPERIPDWLALVGDTSDNIPGIPGVGPKTAARWLQRYGSLDALIEHADEVPGKAGERLRAHLGQLPLARELATVRRDLPLEVGPRDLVPRPPDRERLKALFRDLEFRSMLRELLAEEEQAATGDDDPPGDPQAADYELVLEWPQLERWLERLAAAPLIAIDTETDALDYMAASVVGVSFAIDEDVAAYVPLAHRYPGAPEQLDRDAVLGALKGLLEDPAVAKLGHHLKFDRNVLLNHGIELAGITHDTMLESYVLDSTASRHDMDSLALKYLGRKTVSFTDVAGKGAKQLSFDQVPLEVAGPYAAEDAEVTWRLHRALWPRLEAQPRLAGLYRDIEVPLIPVLSRMERTGVKVDVDMLAAQSRELEARLAELERQAHELAGEPFNLSSPKQLQAILFERLGLPVRAKTPKGQPSTAESVLAELALDYPLPRVILEYRALAKLKSTYTDRLPQQVSPKTGRVHTSYHQAVAATGRLSSSDPNLQNIPVRTAEGRRIRQAFIAEPGCLLLAADYSQIELRILAHLSGDERLRAAFAAGEDVHRATAAEVFGVPPEAVSTEQRRAAKAINFGLVYGMSPFGLARQLGIDRAAAEEYVERYFARYPGVRAFMERTRELAREQGYVETVFGRRLHLPEINAANGQRRQYAERTAINAPMQGSAADIIKRAMIAVDAWLQQGGVEARLIMQVHDELVLEVAEGDVDAVRVAVAERMRGAAELSVPLEVDIGVGRNWDEAH